MSRGENGELIRSDEDFFDAKPFPKIPPPSKSVASRQSLCVDSSIVEEGKSDYPYPVDYNVACEPLAMMNDTSLGGDIFFEKPQSLPYTHTCMSSQIPETLISPKIESDNLLESHATYPQTALLSPHQNGTELFNKGFF